MILKVFSNLVDTKGVIDHILTIFILFLVTPLFPLHHFSQEHTYCFVLHVTLLLYQLKKVIPSDILHSKSYGCTYHKTSICFFTLLRNKHELKGHVKRSRLIFNILLQFFHFYCLLSGKCMNNWSKSSISSTWPFKGMWVQWRFSWISWFVEILNSVSPFWFNSFVFLKMVSNRELAQGSSVVKHGNLWSVLQLLQTRLLVSRSRLLLLLKRSKFLMEYVPDKCRWNRKYDVMLIAIYKHFFCSGKLYQST